MVGSSNGRLWLFPKENKKTLVLRKVPEFNYHYSTAV